jgi:hypothetical protein
MVMPDGAGTSSCPTSSAMICSGASGFRSPPGGSAAVLSSEEPFVAVTRDGRYVGLVPRERAVNEILRAVITH